MITHGRRIRLSSPMWHYVATLYKMEQRVPHDLFYIEHISLWFDLKIIFLTLFKGFVHSNAH